MKTIPDWPEYGICENGDVWRLTRNGSQEPLLKPRKLAQIFGDVRPIVKLTARGIAKSFHVNVLVCLTYHGPKPFPEAHAAHDNGNFKDNRPQNVVWKTKEENEADKFRHGTVRRGSRAGGAKLNEEQVLKIRSLKGGISGRRLGKLYGVTEACIRRIWWGLDWHHLL